MPVLMNAQLNGAVMLTVTITTHVIQVTYDLPEVRQGGFYPQALEKGLRRERALKIVV